MSAEICKSCPKDCRHSFVYVMGGRPDGAVKVGYARDAKKRAAQLRRDTGLPIVLLRRFRVRCEFVAMDVEDAAHVALSSKWSGRGEWFLCSGDEAAHAIEFAMRRVK